MRAFAGRPLSTVTRTAACVLLASSAASNMPLPTDNYFSEYANLYDHIGMLQDHERMAAYHDAIKLNAARHFKDKVVLDVGAGTGVLSIWAAKAGARKVYAVEGTAVARHAEALVAAQGLSSVVTVLRGRMEELELPEKVDVLLSEWMGYFLLRESMVQSVLFARDRWLKPSGVMYPSSARLLISTMEEPGFARARATDVNEAMLQWDALEHELSDRYDLTLAPLREAYRSETVDYFRHNAWQGHVPMGTTVGSPHVLLHVDMHNTTFDELFGWRRVVEIGGAEEVHQLCGWFDVRFCARTAAGGTSSHDISMTSAVDEAVAAGDADDVDHAGCVELSTAPTTAPTHWAHTTLLLDPTRGGQPAECAPRAEQGLPPRPQSDARLSRRRHSARQVEASYAITAEFRTQERTDYDPDAIAEENDDEVDDGMN